MRTEVRLCVLRLRKLAEVYEPVGILVEDARLALRGESGLTEREYRLLVEISSRWGVLPQRLRELYVKHSNNPSVGRALWNMLIADKPTRSSHYDYHILRQLWESEFGCPPTQDLAPVVWVRLAHTRQAVRGAHEE